LVRPWLIGGIAVLAFGSVSDAFAADFKQRWSGWFVDNPEADVNEDLMGGEATFFCRGTFGRSVNHVMADFVFNGAPCELDSGGLGFTLDVIAHTNILVTRNGDQLYRTLSSSPASTVCFVPGEAAVLTAYLDIVGGTGRFEGATGLTVLKTRAVILGQHNSVTGTEEGEVFGVVKLKKKNK
jgi:hypothetical protein